MALEMKEATYARDTAGKKKLISDFQAEIDKAIKTMESEQATVIDTVNKYWLGKDADQFKKDFKENVANMKSDFTRLKKSLDSVLTSDAKEFEKFQSNLAKNLSGGSASTAGTKK